MELPVQRSVVKWERKSPGYMTQMGRHSKAGYALMPREMYLKLFGMGPEEIYTAEQLQRIDEIVARGEPYKRPNYKSGLRRSQSEAMDE